MLINKGYDLSFKTGYNYGYTLYATKTIGQLEVERDIVMFECMHDRNGDLWHIGALEGIEHALYLKRMK